MRLIEKKEDGNIKYYHYIEGDEYILKFQFENTFIFVDATYDDTAIVCNKELEILAEIEPRIINGEYEGIDVLEYIRK